MTSLNKQRKPITIFDVAKKAGVSYSTVSRVANGYQFVKPATRVRVEAAMKELGYVANLKARSLAGGRSQLIGLLVYDFQTSYLVELIRGIDGEMAHLDYEMMLSTTRHRKLKESAHVRALAQGMVDGLLIVLPSNLEAYVEDMSAQDIPFVLLDYTHSGMQNVNTVQAANYQGCYDATSHLIALGHEKIGFITGRMEVGCTRDRLNGYRQALDEHRLEAASQWLAYGDFTEQSGHDGMKKILQEATRPTAMVVSNDEMAFGAIKAIQAAGLRVPEDVSVIGFDDIPEADYFRPKLTTIRQPLQDMGKEAARLLVEMIEKPGATSRQIVLPTELVVRESTMPPPAT